MRPAWIVGVHFGVYFAARAALHAIWPASFADLDAAGLVAAWTRGFVIDSSIIAVTLAPVLLALLLPVSFARGESWRAAWSWLAFAILAAAMLVLAGDIAYFGTVGRHVGPELVAFSDDPALMWGIVWESYRLPLFGMLAAIAALGFGWRRLMRWDERFGAAPGRPWTLIALAPVCLVAIRGNVTGKPIGTVDAFQSGSVSAGYLALNGPFSIVHSIPEAKNLRYEFLPREHAVASVVEGIGARGPVDEYPLWRVAGADDGARHNVVVLLLESWDGDVVDAIRTARGQAPLGLTPHFDELARRGVLFTQFFAAGQRSTHGLFAVLTGLPSLPGMPYLGGGIEQSRLSYLGQAAKAEGYATHFLQGSRERSFRLDAVAALAGFESYAGMETIADRTGAEPMANWGVWDKELLRAANTEFAASPKPFLGLAFTTSTHLPFQVPAGRKLPYPDDGDEHRYWNSIHYADEAIGEFFEAARTAGYHDDTVFVLVSDHRSGLGFSRLGPLDKHHIPCLVIAPGLAPRVESGVRSQLDVFPTIAELAHWNEPLATLGKSLLSQDLPTRGALCMRSEILMRVEADGFVVHDLERRLEAQTGPAAHVDAVEQIEARLLAEVQVVADLLRTNRVVPPPAGH